MDASVIIPFSFLTFKSQLLERNFLLQVNSALHCLRDRNTYHGHNPLAWSRPVPNVPDHCVTLSSFDRSACQTQESELHVNEIKDSSISKARTMVDAAMQVKSGNGRCALLLCF